jgi:putative glutamine amidotransferase
VPAPVLLVVDVSDSDRDDPVYHALLDALTARATADARAVGFAPTRVAADQLGVEGVRAALEESDALLIMGGEDVDPDLYGGPRDYPGAGSWFRRADDAQAAAVRDAVERRIPVVGICRGMQVVNVALGGTLIAHIADSAHVRPGPADESMIDHDVALVPGTDLAATLGADAFAVRSSHHQAVDALGAGLVAAALAPDGVVEALEHTDAPLWAVQWHPEDDGSAGDVLTRLLARARDAVGSGGGQPDTAR